MKRILCCVVAFMLSFSFLNAKGDFVSQKRVFIIHGFDANPSKHWFGWLKSELESKGVSVSVLDLPNSSDPKLEQWLGTIKNAVGKVDENTYFIGHSLGCITTLRFIEGLDESARVGGVLLVSGFYEPLAILPQLDPFVAAPLKASKLEKIIAQRIVLSAKDDSIVPTSLSENLAKKINARFVQSPKGGHFMQDDGFKSLPIALKLIEEELGASCCAVR